MQRVLGCGFQKTATTSLRHALEHLGHRVANFNPTLFDEYQRGRRARIWWNARRFTAYRDWPWAFMWRDFDRTRWVRKFVLTIRDPDTWHDSLVRHIEGSVDKWGADWVQRQMQYLYGVNHPQDNKDACVARYLDHNAEVQSWFRQHPDRLLVFDAEAGDGWDELCGFLGHPVPAMTYPNRQPGS